MAASRRTVLHVWLEEIRGLKRDSQAIKKRSRALPYQFTLGWACATAAAASLVNLYVYKHTATHINQRVWWMYCIGAIGFAVSAFWLLYMWWKGRDTFRSDVDDLIAEMDRIADESPREEAS